MPCRCWDIEHPVERRLWRRSPPSPREAARRASIRNAPSPERSATSLFPFVTRLLQSCCTLCLLLPSIFSIFFYWNSGVTYPYNFAGTFILIFYNYKICRSPHAFYIRNQTSSSLLCLTLTFLLVAAPVVTNTCRRSKIRH